MNDDDVDPGKTLASESGYEPPAIFDFGPVFGVTRGNASGTGDENNQRDD